MTALLGRIATATEEEPLWWSITAGPLPPNGDKPGEKKEIKKEEGVESNEKEVLWWSIEGLAITAGFGLPPNIEKPAEKEIKKDKGVESNTQ